jgi:hypothetical protein
MKRESISIPVSVELINEDSWARLDSKGTSFFVVRFHFQLNERLLDETHKVGDWIGLYQSTKGMSAQHVTAETTEVEQVISRKSIEKHFLESEVLGEIAADLVNTIELPKILKIGSSVKSKISSRLKDSYTSERELLDSHKVTSSHTLEITNHYPAEETEAIVSVPVYRRRSVDIFLSYVDYLKVDYKRSTFGLRKKSKKYPPVTHPKKHDNIYKIGHPVATAYYWELQKNACKFMYEKEHKTEVADPSQITICSPVSTKERFIEFPEVPTLYQIAKAAFPHKWIWRKSANKEWTEDDLKAIELEEVKKLKNGWYNG